MKKLRLAIISPLLGISHRGFESFARECFEALRVDPALDVRLFKRAGPSARGEFRIPSVRAYGRASRVFGRMLHTDPLIIAYDTFAIGLQPWLIGWRPDVVLFSERHIGNRLWHLRRITGLKYHLLFSNGGPFGPPFHRFDHIQHLTPGHYAESLNAGDSSEKLSQVPYGFQVPQDPFPDIGTRQMLRRQLGLSEVGHVVLSVGALNTVHKRMDYVIREVAALPEPRPQLVILGNRDCETPQIEKLGNELLGLDGCIIRTVTCEQVASYYACADVFCLASLQEGFGRVFVEALSWGLPSVAHDYPVTRYVGNGMMTLRNLDQRGSLTDALSELLDVSLSQGDKSIRREEVKMRFGWDALRPQYVDMIKKACGKNV